MCQGPQLQESILPGMISGSFVIRKYKPESVPLYLPCGCLRMCFYTSWWNFANMVSPAKMTNTASTASKFCARSRSEYSDIFFLDLESWWIPGNIEPWPECQPEGSRLQSAKSWNSVCPLARCKIAYCELLISRGVYSIGWKLMPRLLICGCSWKQQYVIT